MKMPILLRIISYFWIKSFFGFGGNFLVVFLFYILSKLKDYFVGKLSMNKWWTNLSQIKVQLKFFN